VERSGVERSGERRTGETEPVAVFSAALHTSHDRCAPRVLLGPVSHTSAVGISAASLQTSRQPLRLRRSSDAASARACPTLLVALGLSSCSVRALASTSYCRHGRRLEGRGSMLPCPPSRWLSSGTLTEQCAVWGSNSSEDWRAGCMRSRSCPTSPVIATSQVERMMGADGCKRDEALRGLRGLRGLVRGSSTRRSPVRPGRVEGMNE
jgi:hypothetical protein